MCAVTALIFVFSMGFSSAHQPETPNFSEAVDALLNVGLNGCVIHMFRRKFDTKSEDHLVYIVKPNQKHPNTRLSFYTTDFQTHLVSKVTDGPNGAYFTERHSRKPWFTYTKFSLCYAQLYFIDYIGALYGLLAYFVQMVQIKLDPRFVILWDNTDAWSHDWLYFYNRPEFIGSFKDYRLYVGKLTKESEYYVGLICIPCAAHREENIGVNYQREIPNPTPKTIHETWHNAHLDHRGLEIAIVCDSDFRFDGCNKAYMYSWLTSTFNVTWRRTTQFMFNRYGVISDNTRLDSRNADVVLQAAWPKLYFTASMIGQRDQLMTTVISKWLLYAGGLTSLVSCFGENVLLCLAILLLILLYLYTVLPCGESVSLFILRLYAPLVDRCVSVPENHVIQKLLFPWAVLCMSLTALYGGEMASSLSVLKPPFYPVSVQNLSSNIVSLDSIELTSGLSSPIADLLEQSLKTNNKRIDYRDSDVRKTQHLVQRLQSSICHTNNVNFTMLRPDSPFQCDNTLLNVTLQKPLTFLGTSVHNNAVKLAFGNSGQYFISPYTRMPMFQVFEPVMMMQNYFAKLAEPVIAGWWMFNLEKPWTVQIDRVAFREKSTKQFVRFPPSDFRTSLVIDYCAADITAFVNLAKLMFSLHGMSLVILFIEKVFTTKIYYW